MSVTEYDEIDEQLPTTPDEQQQNLIDLREIKRRTVEPGVMRLNCKHVTGASNSANFVLELEHPVGDTHRMYVSHPTTGWSDESELSTLLDWYDIVDENPYKLQLEDIYVRHDPDESEQHHGWVLQRPPSKEPEPTWRDRIEEKREYLPRRSSLAAWTTLGLTPVVAGVTIALVGLAGVATAAISIALGLMVYLSLTVMVLAMVNPEVEP